MDGQPVRPPYPHTPREEREESFHGERVADPYRWLESIDERPVRDWVREQTRLARAFLDPLPERNWILGRAQTTTGWDLIDSPRKAGPYILFLRQWGEQPALFSLRRDAAHPSLVLTTSRMASDRTIAIGDWWPSPDGSRVAHELRTAGTDWVEIRVRDVDRTVDFGDSITRVKFPSLEWSANGTGFYYCRPRTAGGETPLLAKLHGSRVMFHQLGTYEESDRVVLDRPDRLDWMFSLHVSDDGRLLVIVARSGLSARTTILTKDLRDETSMVRTLALDAEGEFDWIEQIGEKLWFRTTNGAGRGRIVGIDPRGRPGSAWSDVVPESTDVLTEAHVSADRIVLTYLRDLRPELRVLGSDGRLERTVPAPPGGTLSIVSSGRRDPEILYSVETAFQPSSVRILNVRTGAEAPFLASKFSWRPDVFETRLVHVASADGTSVPMFLFSRKSLAAAQRLPTILHVYGGFGIPSLPAFDYQQFLWTDLGGVVAVACVRGGGEFGKTWHLGGARRNKQRSIDDLLACAHWLAEQEITAPEKLALSGASHGGLLAAAAAIQEPAVCAAVVTNAGPFDMLRYTTASVGPDLVHEFGEPREADDFAVLRRYSPLHRAAAPARYPALLLCTGDHDDRVPPWHSYKLAAALQSTTTGTAPVLLRVERRAGHGAGMSSEQSFGLLFDQLAFLAHTLGLGAPEFPAWTVPRQPRRRR